MKVVPALGLTLLSALVGARVVPGSGPGPFRQDFILALGPKSNASTAKEASFDSTDPVTAAAGDNDPWTLSVARGTKLLVGMKSSDAIAASAYGLDKTAESPFDGDLISKLREWGYNDNTPAMQKTVDKECNMASTSGHMLSKTFLDLGLDTKSKANGGPNQCFQIEHYDGPTVIKEPDGSLPQKAQQYYKVPGCDTKYRVTGAENTIGVNADSGAIFALSLSSAAKSARRLWKVAPTTEQLPHIRSVSDLAWAFWNRAVAGTPGAELQNIKYFFVNMIVNTETNRHIRRALQTLDPPVEEAVSWPGHEFGMETEAGKALLGSPVGRWAGYFLMQHKRQLGGDKFISKVRVFKSEKVGSLPYFLFYVDGAVAATTPTPAPGDGDAALRERGESWALASGVMERNM